MWLRTLLGGRALGARERHLLPFQIRTFSEGEKRRESSSVRINKLLVDKKICSRREADLYLQRGWVRVDGQVAALGMKILPSQKLEVDIPTDLQKDKVNIMMYKPVGWLSQSSDPKPRQRFAKDLLTLENKSWGCNYKGTPPPALQKLAVIGRLDADSEGLLLFSQDGNLARAVIGENSSLEKEYLVRVTDERGEMIEGEERREKVIEELSRQLTLDGKRLKPVKVKWLNESQLRFILREGRNRQIRRMCAAIGLKVARLKRVRVGGLKLGALKVGKWKTFEASELLG